MKASLEWKVEGVTDGESESGDCEEVMYTGWGESGFRSEQNEVGGTKKGADSTGKVTHISIHPTDQSVLSLKQLLHTLYYIKLFIEMWPY